MTTGGVTSPTQQVFSPTPASVHWGHFDGSLAPIGVVSEGEAFTVQSVSAFPDDPEPDKFIAPEAVAIFQSAIARGPGPHLLTGPIGVADAHPGDVLEVRIHDVRLRAAYGYNLIHPFLGLFHDRVERPERMIIPIDQQTGAVTVPGGAIARARPFFGIIGVGPPLGWGRIDCREPRRHGGNLDNKELVAGSILFLPVFVEGALLSIGDGHALQGDGEVDVTAVETSLEGDFSVRVRRDFALDLPIARTATHLITMGFDPDLDDAVSIATKVMIDLLSEHSRLSWNDAYRLCSLCADLRVTQVVNGQKGIHCMMPLDIINQLTGSIPALTSET
jgi:acetamidase/formamidase